MKSPDFSAIAFVTLVIIGVAPVTTRGSARNPDVAPGGVSFVETGQQLNRLAGRGVAVADFNGDGFLDAFVANEYSPDGQGYRIYFGDGHGRFGNSGQQLANPSNWGAKPAAGDVNGDGNIDMITDRTVWFNDGQGHFTSHPELIENTEAGILRLVKLADLNGDGALDLFAICNWNSIRVYLNDGQGHFRDTGQRLGLGENAGSAIMGAVALGDVDGDGAIDAVVGGWRNEPGDPCPNRIWLNDGKGNFRDGGQQLDEGEYHVHGVALGDVDGNGAADIVLALTKSGRAGKIYLNDGKGRFRDSGQIIGHTWAHAVALGDLNGDGYPDVFLACGNPRTGTPNEVWLNDGKGGFRDSGLRLGSTLSWDVALGDLNGDQQLDAVVVNFCVVDSSKNPPIFGGVPLEIWLNTTPVGIPARATTMAATGPRYSGESPSGDAAVVQAVLAANARLTDAANRLDTDAFFAGIVDSDETRIIQDGKLFKTRAEAMAAVRQGSQGVAKLERNFNDPHVTLLAPGVALLTAEGTTAVILQDGRTFDNRFAVSLVFVLRDGRWMLFHGHYSLPNPPA